MSVAEQQDRDQEHEENPLTAGLERLPIAPTTMTIFGGTGDLARRKLLPALYNLAHEGALPERFNLIGVSRSEMPHEEYQQQAREAIQEFSRRETDEKVLDALLANVRYVSGSFDETETFEQLSKLVDEFDEGSDVPFNRCYYLSTAPEFFPVIVEALGEHGLDHHDDADVRVVIEKPFGTNLQEARELNERVLGVFDEDQVFRIDHYLGKETVQNVLAFRFANGLFEPIWNRNYIDHVQITASEELGIGETAGFYDKSRPAEPLHLKHLLHPVCLPCIGPQARFPAAPASPENATGL